MSSMVDYVNSVVLTGNETINDAAEISHRLLRWLRHLNQSVYLESAVAEAVLQAAAILSYFAQKFANLKNSLHHRWTSTTQPFDTDDLGMFYDRLFDDRDGGPMRYIGQLVLTSVNGSRHFAIAVKYMDDFIDKDNRSADVAAAIAEAEAINAHVVDTHRLLDEIFALRNDDIPTAINRIIDFQYSGELTFEHIATIVCLTTGGSSYRKEALVFAAELIRRLETGTIHPRFVESIYQSADPSGLFRVLRVGIFVRPFCSFLVNCLLEFRFDDVVNSYVPSHKLHGIDFKHVAYVIGLILGATTSTVRAILCREILGQPAIDPVLIEHLNDQKFVQRI